MVIQAEGVVKSYGQSVAVDHIDLNINQGDIHGVLGPEGSWQINSDCMSPFSDRI